MSDEFTAQTLSAASDEIESLKARNRALTAGLRALIHGFAFGLITDDDIDEARALLES